MLVFAGYSEDSQTPTTPDTTPDMPKNNEFPLWKHKATGQWCRKVKGRFYYFGTDRETALARWLKEKDFLLAGKEPPADELQLRDILNGFHESKTQANREGRLADRTLREYVDVLDKIASTIGRTTPTKLIDGSELEALRVSLITGKSGTFVSPTSQKRFLSIARSVFNYGNEELAAGIRYKKALQPPTAKQLRRSRHATGERLFEPIELRDLLDGASEPLRAMILLGINCAFGNRDCAKLTVDRLDLEGGWHNFARPKTEQPRRCPLWSETIDALRVVVSGRQTGYVFQTVRGNPWFNDDVRDCPISKEFRKLCVALGIYRKNVTTFYTLRRTFATIASTANEPLAVKRIMGHVDEANDMQAVYRQKVFDDSLIRVSNVVRDWLYEKERTRGE